MVTTPPGGRTPGGRPAPTLGASPPARRPRTRDTAPVPAVVPAMTAAELTTITQQLIAQVASDHAWFGSITDDMNDHAVRLDKLTMVTTTNQVEVKATQVESQRLFQIVDLNDTTIKGVVSTHDDLLKQVDTALRAQVQTEVSRLDALLAELKTSTSESGHAQALAGLRNLEGEVRSHIQNTNGHLNDLKGAVGGLQAAGANLGNHLQGVETALCQRVEQLAHEMQQQQQRQQPSPAYQQARAQGAQESTPVGGSVSEKLTGVPMFPPTCGRPTVYQPTGPAAAPAPGVSTGLFGADGFWSGPAPGQGDSQPQPPRHHYGTPGRGNDQPESGAGRRVIFDKKVAQNPHFQFDHNNQEKWMATVKNYLIGERWEMVDLLDWAERFEKTSIEEHHLKSVGNSDLMQDAGLDTIQASQELWAFLNLNLVGSARAKFDKAPRLNGFDVWRRVVCPMAPKSVARRVDLHTDLHNPARAKKLSDLIETVEAWERLRSEGTYIQINIAVHHRFAQQLSCTILLLSYCILKRHRLESTLSPDYIEL